MKSLFSKNVLSFSLKCTEKKVMGIFVIFNGKKTVKVVVLGEGKLQFKNGVQIWSRRKL